MSVRRTAGFYKKSPTTPKNEPKSPQTPQPCKTSQPRGGAALLPEALPAARLRAAARWPWGTAEPHARAGAGSWGPRDPSPTSRGDGDPRPARLCRAALRQEKCGRGGAGAAGREQDGCRAPSPPPHRAPQQSNPFLRPRSGPITILHLNNSPLWVLALLSRVEMSPLTPASPPRSLTPLSGCPSPARSSPRARPACLLTTVCHQLLITFRFIFTFQYRYKSQRYSNYINYSISAAGRVKGRRRDG